MAEDNKHSSASICPSCGAQMGECEEQAVTLDQCPSCLGVWFDEGEIQRFLRTKRPLDLYVPAHVRQWRKGSRPCPRCGRSMLVLHANSAFPFDIDMCAVHKGYWIDGDEVRQLMETVRRRTPRLRERKSTSGATAWRQRQVARQVEQVEKKIKRGSYQAHPAIEQASTGEVLSLSDFSGPQILLALIGIPVEQDRMYRWKSFANLLIIGLTVFVYYRMSTSGAMHRLIVEWGFIPREFAADRLGSSMEALASVFIHVNLAHLIGNMLFLFITGDDVERRTGHLLYPVFYIACGAAATAASYVHGSAPGVPHVGASGAVAGTMGAYLVFCYYKSLCFRWWWRLIVLPSWIYLLFWVATQVLFMQLGEGRIDYAAHVGGFAFGAVTAGILSALQTYNPYTGDWQWRFFRSAAAGS